MAIDDVNKKDDAAEDADAKNAVKSNEQNQDATSQANEIQLRKELDNLKGTQKAHQEKADKAQLALDNLKESLVKGLGIDLATEDKKILTAEEVLAQVMTLRDELDLSKSEKLIDVEVKTLASSVDEPYQRLIIQRAIVAKIKPAQVRDFVINELDILDKTLGERIKIKAKDSRPEGGTFQGVHKARANEILEKYGKA